MLRLERCHDISVFTSITEANKVLGKKNTATILDSHAFYNEYFGENFYLYSDGRSNLEYLIEYDSYNQEWHVLFADFVSQTVYYIDERGVGDNGAKSETIIKYMGV
ncbi:hypothetical protein RF11_04159 [Thelohanellus kitauei]|uniref:Uncharacterized protein n=1 Tax=Thelohanellus kitauei TaxID=669202 RepID=A0A0C2N2X8_THEKT|nr:hypothetical protein RF11_04159 [Thelohanellus kitauei]